MYLPFWIQTEQPQPIVNSLLIQFHLLAERLANHKCEACNQKLEVTPHVHHITPKVDGGSNADSNLIVLCRNCHGKAHGRTYTNKQLKGFIKKRKKK